jgi:hypothetical protein
VSHAATPSPGAADTGLVGALAAVFLGWTTLPGVHWHDTAGLASAGQLLTLSHPPGHPVHAHWVHAFTRWLPFGDVGFRANLSSAAAMVVAAVVLHRVLVAVAPRLPRWATCAVALWSALMPSMWLNAVRAEVYALQLAGSVLVIALSLAVVSGDRRAGVGLGLVFGVLGANHSLMGVALLPVAVGALLVGRVGLRAVGLGAAAGVLGLLAYAYLPLRAHAGLDVGWGLPVDTSSIANTILARDWSGNLVKEAELDLLVNLAALGALGVEQVGPLGVLVLLTALGAGLLPLVAARRVLALGLALAVLGAFATRMFYPFDPLNPDLGGYYAVGWVSLLVLAWAAADAAVEPRVRLGLAVGSVLAATLGLGLAAYDPGGRRGARSAEVYTRALLAETPPGGALMLSDYSSWFLAGHLFAAEGARPDVARVFRGRAEAPWFAARLGRVHPEVAAALPALPTGPAARYEPGVEMRRLRGLAGRLVPAGRTFRIDGAAAPPDRAAGWGMPAAPDLDTRRILAAHHVAHAEWAGARFPDVARAHLDAAETLAPGDPFIATFRARLSRRGADAAPP